MNFKLKVHKEHRKADAVRSLGHTHAIYTKIYSDDDDQTNELTRKKYGGERTSRRRKIIIIKRQHWFNGIWPKWNQIKLISFHETNELINFEWKAERDKNWELLRTRMHD